MVFNRARLELLAKTITVFVIGAGRHSNMSRCTRSVPNYWCHDHDHACGNPPRQRAIAQRFSAMARTRSAGERRRFPVIEVERTPLKGIGLSGIALVLGEW